MKEQRRGNAAAWDEIFLSAIGGRVVVLAETGMKSQNKKQKRETGSDGKNGLRSQKGHWVADSGRGRDKASKDRKEIPDGGFWGDSEQKPFGRWEKYLL